LRVGKEEEAAVSSAEENKAIARHLEEELARGNLDVIDELLAPDFVDRALLPGQGPTREDFKRGEDAPLSSRGGAGREVLSIPPFPKTLSENFSMNLEQRRISPRMGLPK